MYFQYKKQLWVQKLLRISNLPIYSLWGMLEMFESSFYGEYPSKYGKIEVLDKICDLLNEEDDVEKRQWLLCFEEAVECDEADDGTIFDVMNVSL